MANLPESSFLTAGSETEVPNAWRAATEKSRAIARIGLSSIRGRSRGGANPMLNDTGRGAMRNGTRGRSARPCETAHLGEPWSVVVDRLDQTGTSRTSRMPMTPPLQDRAPRRSWLIAGVALLVLVLAAVLLTRGGDGGDTGPDSPSGSPGQSSPTSTLPPAPVPPGSVVDEASLTVPEELRAADGSFYLERGTSYLASFEVSTMKSPGEPGLAMYLGVTFSCAGADGGVSEWIGGTENLLVDQPVTYRNQLLLEPQQSQVVSCSVRANAPYDDVAAAGATIDLDISWSVRPVDGGAVSTPSEQRLPMTIDPGEREFVFL